MQDARSGNEFITARRDVLDVSVDDCLVLYDPRTQRGHVLNASAARIWGMVQGGAQITAVTAALIEESGGAPAAVEADVREAMARLTQEGLVGALPEQAANVGPGSSVRSVDGASGHRHPRTATLGLLDRTVAFESDSSDLVAAIDWLAAPLATRERPGEVYEVEGSPGRTRLFPSELNRIAAASTAVTVLHAAAVVVGDAVVALPGSPRAGKSTLATGLVSDGYGYLTDEVLGVAPRSLRVVGLPKRITLELGSWALFPQLAAVQSEASHPAFDPTRVRWVDPRLLHPNALAWRGRPLELGLGVLATYEAGASLQLERLRPVDVLTALMANSFNLGVMNREGLDTLRDVATTTPFYRMVHGGIDEAVPAIRELLLDEGVASAS